MTTQSFERASSVGEPICVSCGAHDVTSCGPIPDATIFAGALRETLPGGALWQCQKCRLGFRYPRLSFEQAEAMYDDAPGTAWCHSFGERPDWLIARGWLAEHGGRPMDILDIGCADGRFLIDGVSADHRKFGVEINPVSSAAAAAAGIEIIGKTLADVPGGDGRFDVITAFDVIEHVFDPRDFVVKASALLREGGRLILATGDFTSRTFQFMGGRYWYVGIPEHVCFISRDWCENVAQITGTTLHRQERYAHQIAGAPTKIRQASANLFYKFFPTAYSSLRQKISTYRPSVADASPPSWMTARDHLIVELRR